MFCLLAGSSHPSEKCRAQSENGKIQWVADERIIKDPKSQSLFLNQKEYLNISEL